jgi:hypothetical protein
MMCVTVFSRHVCLFWGGVLLRGREEECFTYLQQIDLRCNLLGTLPDCFSVMHKFKELKELVLGNNLVETLPERKV